MNIMSAILSCSRALHSYAEYVKQAIKSSFCFSCVALATLEAEWEKKNSMDPILW